MHKITFEKKIGVCGNSLAINISKELKIIELEKGDVVRVTLERITES